MPPPHRIHKPNAIIILNNFINSKIIPKFEKKAFHQLVELVESNPLIHNTFDFDQYSRLSIRLNIFWFSAKKVKSKFEKSFS